MSSSVMRDDRDSQELGGGGASDRTLLIVSGIVWSLFIVVALILNATGQKGRSFAAPAVVRQIEGPHLAYPVWKAAGVRGRILVLFDRRLNATGSLGPMVKEDPPLQEDNYVYLAARNNIVRTIYHVIPRAAWQEVEAAIKGNPYVSASGGGYRTATDDGIPLYITRLEDLPPFKEPVLVNINVQLLSDDEVILIEELREKGGFSSDLMTLSGHSPRMLKPGDKS